MCMAVEPLPADAPSRFPRQRLTVAWIVEETIRFYREHLITLLSLFLIANIITWSIQYYSGRQVDLLFEKHNVTLQEILDDPEAAYSKAMPILLDLLLLMVMGTIVLIVISLFVQAAAIRFVYDRLVGDYTSWQTTLSRVVSSFPLLLAAVVISGLIVALGLIALIVPGIILGIMFILVPHSVIVEGKGPISALSRSSELTSGNKWNILLFLAFWFVVLLLFSMVIRQVAPSVWMDLVQLLEGTLFGPVIPVSTTIVYHRLSQSTP
jgi:hypothetical protein